MKHVKKKRKNIQHMMLSEHENPVERIQPTTKSKTGEMVFSIKA
jgi:hypothetical protein